MRKYLTIVLIGLVSLSFCCPSCAPPPKEVSTAAKIDTPTTISDRENFFQAGRFYFAGQPDEETFRWLAAEGVEAVINLRTDKEMETHTKDKFDEVALLKELGMAYLHFPMGGKVGYSPHVVDTLAQVLIEHEGNVLIHCRSAGRVSYLWIAYLVKYQGLTIDEAVDIGKRITFRFPLEDLLGYPVTMQRKKEI